MANQLLAWCETNDRTITEVADLSGYSVAYMSLISRGARMPPPHVKVTIARALGVRIADIFPVRRETASA